MNVTVDTNILVRAFCDFEQDHLHITGLIGRNGVKLCYDFLPESVITKEYEKNVGKSVAYRKWFTRLNQVQAFHYCSGKLSKKHRAKLVGFQCHEPSDHVFIAVAFNSGKILISEDSDVGKGPRGEEHPHPQALDYLTNDMGLSIYDAREASEFFSK